METQQHNLTNYEDAVRNFRLEVPERGATGPLRGMTAAYKYPGEIEFVTELAETISGKIRRVELRGRR